MSRLQTKCVMASAGVHLLLLALVVISSAFVKPPPPPEEVRFIKMFNAAKITDDETSGGGNPNAAPVEATQTATPTPAPPEPVAPTPVVRTPDPIPVAPKPEVKVQEPEIEKPREVVKPKPEPPKPKPKPVEKIVEKPKVTPKLVEKPKLPDLRKDPKPEAQKPAFVIPEKKVATIDPEVQRKRLKEIEDAKRKDREAREQAVADARAYAESVKEANRIAAERRSAIQGAVGTVSSKISGSTIIEMPGPGGEAFINYSEFVWSKYYAAWQTPEERAGATSVGVEIVVARDGRVISSNITRRSGDAALDKSVRQALDRVRALPRFPEGARDLTRTFKINFTLEAKRQRG
jgi:colicin import membrane protein